MAKIAEKISDTIKKDGGLVRAESVRIEPVVRKKPVLTDLDRQLFNVETSIVEFKRQARRKEAASLKARRQCRRMLEKGRLEQARSAAVRAINARETTLACTVTSRRMEDVVELVKEEITANKTLKPIIAKALKNLDFAIRTVDVQIAQTALRVVEFHMGLRGEDHFDESDTEVHKTDSEVNDEEVDKYLSQLQEEIAILSQLKAENGLDEAYTGISNVRPSSPTSSTSRSDSLVHKSSRKTISFFDE